MTGAARGGAVAAIDRGLCAAADTAEPVAALSIDAVVMDVAALAPVAATAADDVAAGLIRDGLGIRVGRSPAVDARACRQQDDQRHERPSAPPEPHHDQLLGEELPLDDRRDRMHRHKIWPSQPPCQRNRHATARTACVAAGSGKSRVVFTPPSRSVRRSRTARRGCSPRLFTSTPTGLSYRWG